MKVRDSAVKLLESLPPEVTVAQMITGLKALTPPEKDPPPLYEGWRRAVTLAVTIISGVAGVHTILKILQKGFATNADGLSTFFLYYAFWMFAPPTWFFIEYVWLFDPLRGNALRVADFTASQSLAQRIWAALLAFMSVYALLTWKIKF